jgi:hypothetical protein
MEIAFGDLNYFAVVVAVVINMVLGALWYGPVLGKAWMAQNNLTMEMIKEQGSPTKGYIIALVASVVIAFAIAILANATGVANAGEGALLGAIVSVGLTATAFASSYVFESKALKHYLINAGYPVVSAVLIGTLIGGWQ